MNFADRLDAAVREKSSPCLLGLDPHLSLLPEEYAGAGDAAAPRAARAGAVSDFLCALTDLCADRVAVVKPQSAFFEVLGADGAAAWERVVSHAHSRGLLVIGDVKRGDIASTAAAYATAFLEGSGGAEDPALCDALEGLEVSAFQGRMDGLHSVLVLTDLALSAEPALQQRGNHMAKQETIGPIFA